MNTPSTVQCPKCLAQNPEGSRFCNACAEPIDSPSIMSAAVDPPIEFTEAPAAPRLGLAIASLVLGLGACILSLLVVGAVFGMIGLVLGLIHILQKRGATGMALWGLGLSIFGILASIAMCLYIYHEIFTPRMKGFTTASDYTFNQWIGVQAPDITISTLDGKSILLSQLKGKRVVLDFWATWCGPCVMEMPHLERLNSESSRDDLVIIGISNEDETTIRSFIAPKGVHYPVASSNNLPSPYRDVRAIPTKFFIDRNGIVQSVFVGSLNYDQLKMQALTTDFQGMRKASPGEATRVRDPINLKKSLSSTDPWVGIWKFNPEKSMPQSAAGTNSADSMVTYREIDPDTIEITSAQVFKDGSNVVSWKCTVPKSGGIQNYLQGSPGAGLTIIVTVVDDHTQNLIYLQNGKQVRISSLVLSKDSKTYTLSWEDKDVRGRSYEQVSVFEKQ